MEIVELELKHYGKFSGHKIAFKPGVNIVYGANEAGKTTIHSFLRAMFFGLGKNRGRVSKSDEYKLRQPWENPGYFAGSMKIAQGAQSYTLERNFDKGHQAFSMFDESTGREIPQPDSFLTMMFGGMSESAFCNTVFVRQAHGETEEELMEELQHFMVNYENAGDHETDVSAALASLKQKKKEFEQQKKREEELLEKQIGGRQSEFDYLRKELETLKDREAAMSGGRNPLRRSTSQASCQQGRPEIYQQGRSETYQQARSDTYQQIRSDTYQQIRPDTYQQARPETYQQGRQVPYAQTRPTSETEREGNGKLQIILEVLLVFAALLSFAGACFLDYQPLKIFLGVFGFLFLICLILIHLFMGEDTSGKDDAGAEALQNQHEERAWQMGVLKEDIRNKEVRYRKLQSELDDLYQNQTRLKEIETEIEAISLAMERITNLSTDLFQKGGGSLNRDASAILSAITGGKYNQVFLDEDMEIRVRSGNRQITLQEVSYGTMQQIYFSLRMAAGNILAYGQNLPLILDEPFSMYDDKRLEEVLRWLYLSGRQVILFTCQERERKILEKVKKPA